MNFFDGDHRKRPSQVLRGNRHAESRNELLQRAAEDRRQREELRIKEKRSVVVQSLARRFLTVARQKATLLKQIDKAKAELATTQEISLVLPFIRGANIFIFQKQNTNSTKKNDSGAPFPNTNTSGAPYLNTNTSGALFLNTSTSGAPFPNTVKSDGGAPFLNASDSGALFFLCQNIIRLKSAFLSECLKDPDTALTLAKFLGGALRLASQTDKTAVADVNSALRLAEIFVGNVALPEKTRKAVCVALIKRGFFRSCLTILISRSSGLSLSSSSTPVGVLHASLYSLLLQPLLVLLENAESLLENAESSASLAVSHFCTEVLSVSYEEVVNAFVIRSFADRQTSQKTTENSQKTAENSQKTTENLQKTTENSQKTVSPVVFVAILAGLIDSQTSVLKADIWLCWSLMVILRGWSNSLTSGRSPAVLRVLSFALGAFFAPSSTVSEEKLSQFIPMEVEDESGDEEMGAGPFPFGGQTQMGGSSVVESRARDEVYEILELPSFVSMILASLEVKTLSSVEDAACICTSLIMNPHKGGEEKQMPTLFYKFAFNMNFLRTLWRLINQFNVVSTLFLNPTVFDFTQNKTSIRLYSVFCKLLVTTMATVYDDEFSSAGKKNISHSEKNNSENFSGEKNNSENFLGEKNNSENFSGAKNNSENFSSEKNNSENFSGEKNNSDFSSGAKNNSGFEFSLEEVVEIAASAKDVASGLIFLTYLSTPHPDPEYPGIMAYLFVSVVQLIKELHDRDARRSFCPEDFWISQRLSALAERTKRSGFKQFIYDIYEKTNPFKTLRHNSSFAGASLEDLRFSLVLDQTPCLIPFQQRLLFLYLFLKAEKNSFRTELDFLRPDSHIQVKVRRDYIYQDAFSDLDPNVVTDLRKSLKVTFQNLAGLDEAGVDGGGLFREFMNQTLRCGFDAKLGFFRNNEEETLYPNPLAVLLFPTNFQKHFFFLGRLLGKAIYENLLTELHFADFFLKKLLAKKTIGNVDIHYLKSLDSTLFKNLLALKKEPENVSELQLDFSVSVDEIGLMKQIDLKPNGRNILVTKDNVVEYIFLMADFKLNRQIAVHTKFFRDGLSDVVPIQLLQIFNFKELQTLISGTEEPIDVKDWRKNTSYGNPYDEEHPTIQTFWKIVQSFGEPAKRKLLKFVTSCSRPPLLGFKDLPHKFTINPVTGQDRLPTASTCMNLLKLPNISDEEKLRQKLIYAIESEAGFELS